MQICYIYMVKQGAITKIGITDDHKERFAQIVYDTESPIKVLFCSRIAFTKQVEQYIKRKYKHKRKKHKGSGKTEWFALNFLDRFYLWLVLWIIVALNWLFVLSMLTVLALGLISISI